MTLVEKVEKLIKNTDWEVSDCGSYLHFSTSTPAGQDAFIEVSISGKSLSGQFLSVVSEVENFVDGFDVSYETYLWLDNTGHGKSGAPYDMKDLYEDMECYLDKAKELLEALKG